MEEYVCLKVYILLNKGKFHRVRRAIYVVTLGFLQKSNWKIFKSDMFRY